jgi:pimeloyl-ACP methyl ester carboxylesterase
VGEKFRFASADGTRVWGWRNGHADGIPVVISNGLGTPPEAWPALIEHPALRTCTWYYRGTIGDDRPSDPSRVTVHDHVEDLLALMDHEGIDQALLACWSLGVNVAFEFAQRHPDRVAGLLAVAGVPGGTFRAMGAPLGIPRPLRHHVGVNAAKVLRLAGPALNRLARTIPLNRVTANVINHSGFVLPAAKAERLIPALAEFRCHDFTWYFTLAIGAADHDPMDLSFLDVPVTLVAGRHDVLTSMHDMVEAASQIPHAEVHVLPGSHFLPLEYPDELCGEVFRLAERTVFADRRPVADKPTAPISR